MSLIVQIVSISPCRPVAQSQVYCVSFASGASRQLCERSVGTEPLAYFLKFQFQRENAKPDRHSQRDGRKLKPNGPLLS